ncbi:X-ray radiation resistance-associated protein 1 [Bulinus truncatus]|nr:X-ray radiation resistance-associated protein 1 [Bulinus truncatus]
MALAGIKLDDDRGSFISNCFPVRSALGRFNSEASGKWLEVQQTEQKRRLKALLTSKPLTYARIKEERKKTEKQGLKLESHAFENEEEEQDGKILDGFFLMQQCCVDDPSDLCSINILNKELTDVKEDDLAMFDNVAYINAGENYLPLEAFRGFPSLRELELPLNGVRSLHISHTDFVHLEMLDLSYNNLSQSDVLTLGFLHNLKVLHLTGNNFTHLPTELALPFVSQDKKLFIPRFANLEVLLLDDNKLKEISIFAALAGLQKLVHLDLSKNEIFFVPQLKSVEGRLITQDSAKQKSSKKSSRKSSRHSARKEKSDISDKGYTNGRDSKLDENNETNFQDLMSEDFLAGDLHSKLDDLDLETENSDLSAYNRSKEIQKPPFPELRYLNLANNKIFEEEGILALAAWPMLAELDIYNNPLTTETSGDPPLLKRFLQDRLGIKLNRKKPQEQLVPGNRRRGNIHPKAVKVTDHVPKVPKVSVENKMLLFSGHGMKPISEGKSVLPPIPTESKDDGENLSPEEVDAEVVEENDSSETFFMTQLDDVERHAKKDNVRSSDAAPTFHDVYVPRPPEEGAPEKLDDKYRGYELLLDAEDLEDDPDLPPSSDVSGNVRALKHTLSHLLVYRDPSVNLNKVQMLVPVHRKEKIHPSHPVQSYQEKVDDVLNNLKNRKTYEEEDLSRVLKDEQLIKEKFPEAENLIGQIQRRYNAVRVHSLKHAKSAQQLSDTVKQLVTKSGMQPINTGGEKK